MKEQAPAQAREAVLTLVKDGGHQQSRRDFSEFVNVITQWTREHSREQVKGWLKCDKGEFKAHWKGRGRKKKVIKAKWKAATAPEKFRKKLAWEKVWHTSKGKKKKKTIVWVRKQDEAADRDVIKNTASFDPVTNRMDKKAAAHFTLGNKPDVSKKSVAALGAGIYQSYSHTDTQSFSHTVIQ